MGLLDTLFGRTKPVRADLDALFALPSAAVTLEISAGMVPSGKAGVCWKPPAGQGAQDLQNQIEELIAMGDDPPDPAADEAAFSLNDAAPDPGTGTSETTPPKAGDQSPTSPSPPSSVSSTNSASATSATPPNVGRLTQAQDSFGYRWLLLDDPELDDLVSRVHLINTMLTENGWGPQLLCSVFSMKPSDQAAPDAKSFYLVYLYKRGTFYPFAPCGKEQRDNELELHIRGVVGSDLPIEQDLNRWFPLWDLPVPSR